MSKTVSGIRDIVAGRGGGDGAGARRLGPAGEQAGRRTAHAYPAENREPAELVDGVVLGGGATSWSGSRRSASLHSSLHGLPYPPYAGPVLLSPHRA